MTAMASAAAATVRKLNGRRMRSNITEGNNNRQAIRTVLEVGLSRGTII